MRLREVNRQLCSLGSSLHPYSQRPGGRSGVLYWQLAANTERSMQCEIPISILAP